MILIYHLMSTLVFFLALPVLPLVYLLSEKRRANLLQRLGLCTGFFWGKKGRFRIWVHALSVGEVRSAIPFVQALKKKRPGAQIVFTASTKTGLETAQQLFSGDNRLLVFQMGYFPFDLWVSVQRICKLIEPNLVCLIETDCWPGFLDHMKQKNIPVVLVNARISKESLNGYLKLKGFCSLFFPCLSHIMAQTALDAQRFKQMGVRESNLSIMGNIKFDQPLIHLDESAILNLKARFGIQDQDRVWIAGSTHEGEETILLEAFASVKKNFPNLKLILAPRDPNRSEKLMGLASFAHHSVLFSQLKQDSGQKDIILIDSLGLLVTAYAICDIAFIGGSLIPLGGHNPLEPALFGKPILLGPHMTDFLEVSDLLKVAKGAVQVDSVSLHRYLEKLLGNDVLAKQMGTASFQVFLENSGAVARTLKKMEDLHFV
jgi:3-deoxy-D-manno-octulosonic-acid transferase